MAVIAFDTLDCARRLKAAGFTDQQAEMQAQIMAESFIHNAEALVTRDYLDVRLQATEDRLMGRLRLFLWSQGVVIAVVLIPALRGLLAPL